MQRPDYHGGSIVNLMTSLAEGLGGAPAAPVPLRLLPGGRVAAARNVVLLVLDGLGFDYLAARGAAGGIRSGLLGPIDSVYPPTTATAITTFLTGLAPAQHGLVGWFTYFREIGAVTTVLPFTMRPARVPLAAARVRAAGLFGLTAVFDRIPAASTAVLPRHLVDSEYSRALGGRAERVGFRTFAGLVRKVSAAVRRGGGRRFVYAYWPELDRLAHRHGVGSDLVARHLADLDAGVAVLRRALLGTETLLVVCADHGFVDVAPAGRLRLEDYPALADALVLPLCGEPRTAYCYVHPERYGDFGRLAESLLGEAVEALPSARLPEEGWLGPGDPHPRLHQRLGHWTLRLRDGWCLTDRLLGEAAHPMVGFHGGASDAERRVPLAVWAL